MKTCKKCGQTKPAEAFNRDKRRTDGRCPWCRLCRSKDPVRFLMTPEQRVLARVHMAETEDCWRFDGRLKSTGYGEVRYRGAHVGAHVAVYRILVGAIPADTVLDHLCRRRWCCNPFHLEPVSHRINILRGISPVAINAKKTHCVNGHQFTPENTYLNQLGRACKACGVLASRRYAERQRNDSYQRPQAEIDADDALEDVPF